MPRSIKIFEILQLIPLSFGFVFTSFKMMTIKTSLQAYVIFALLIFVYGLILLVILLVSRKASNVAKWVLIITFLGGSILHASQTARIVTGQGGIYPSINLLMEFVSLLLLFTNESKIWFKTKGGKFLPEGQ